MCPFFYVFGFWPPDEVASEMVSIECNLSCPCRCEDFPEIFTQGGSGADFKARASSHLPSGEAGALQILLLVYLHNSDSWEHFFHSGWCGISFRQLL